MSHVIERASSGRAKCRACGGKIASGDLRFGERLPNPFADEGGEMTHWFHLWCAAYRRPSALLATVNAEGAALPDGLTDLETLKREAELGVAHHRVPRVNTAERASTGRAVCRACKQGIAKDAWRISLLYYEDGRFQPSGFVHVACARTYFETGAIMPRLKHFSPELTDADFGEIEAALAESS
jgi:ribosomal protein L37AE/L43A